MYRDEPLDDELELRELVGDPAVDRVLAEGGVEALQGALDALRILQGWVTASECADWLSGPQRRLAGRSPLEALAGGAREEVEDVLRAYVAAQS